MSAISGLQDQIDEFGTGRYIFLCFLRFFFSGQIKEIIDIGNTSHFLFLSDIGNTGKLLSHISFRSLDVYSFGGCFFLSGKL